jgi:hypothetical protein
MLRLTVAETAGPCRRGGGGICPFAPQHPSTHRNERVLNAESTLTVRTDEFSGV